LNFKPPYPLDTAILFLLFNRPETTLKVFKSIRLAKPSKIYVAIDGPRKKFKSDKNKIYKIKKILKKIDWPCKVKTLIRKKNLGSAKAVTDAIAWFFKYEKKGIILEDDCLPAQSFFWFCQELLNKYNDNKNIFSISGHSPFKILLKKKGDYFFSGLGSSWGWATWRRSWKLYDKDMKNLNKLLKSDKLKKQLGFFGAHIRKLSLLEAFDQIKKKKIDAWDYQLGVSRQLNNGLVCIPYKNLIENIGFNKFSTHTKTSPYSKRITSSNLTFPIVHPKIKITKEYSNRTLILIAIEFLKSYIKSLSNIKKT